MTDLIHCTLSCQYIRTKAGKIRTKVYFHTYRLFIRIWNYSLIKTHLSNTYIKSLNVKRIELYETLKPTQYHLSAVSYVLKTIKQ